ncbi:MFS transporter [Alicyclobacillus hesperidum]|uniref:MFS transporter n=1 Tax=Alicyclobacillus hesperidum TaxID=89784 RepID=A0AA37UDF6_9BACL|nr:MFS transporter [Alicyclobacillus hesperidum]GLV13604.1 MFS transporter [Alicyclobacillus hesperidum]
MKSKSSFWTYQNGIIVMMFFAFGLVFMDRQSITFLEPFIIPALHLNNAQIGMFASALSVCWGVSAWFFSSYSDLIGHRKPILVIFMVIFALTSVLSGVVGSFLAMFFVRALMGLSEGPVFPIGATAVKSVSTPSRQGFNIGFVQSASGLLGSAIAPLVVVGLANAFNWRVAFYLLAIPALILTLIVAKYMREPQIRYEDTQAEVHRLRWSDYKVIFRNRNTWLCLICSIGFITWLITFATFAPVLMTEVDHISTTQMSWAMSAFGFGSWIWGFVVPFISDRIGRKPALIASGLLATLAPLVLAEVHTGIGVLIVLLFVLAIGQGFSPVVMSIIPSESVPAVFAASTIGLMMMIGEIFGGTVVPTLAGVAADHFGLTMPMFIAAAGSFLVFLIGFGVRETAPRKVGQTRRGENQASVSTPSI